MESWARNTPCPETPLCRSEDQSRLEKYLLFPCQRGSRLELIEPNTTDEGAEQCSRNRWSHVTDCHRKEGNHGTGNSRRRKCLQHGILTSKLLMTQRTWKLVFYLPYPSLLSPHEQTGLNGSLSVCEQLLRDGTDTFSSFFQYFRPRG